MPQMTIAVAARRAGVNLQTVRFYERRRLIPRPPRTASGYRIFTDDDVRRIRFIKQAQSLGFSLREIAELIGIPIDPRADCAAIRAGADAKIAEIEAKIRTLAAMRDTLSRLTRRCPSRGPVRDCPIWDCLNTDHLGAACQDGAERRAGARRRRTTGRTAHKRGAL
jgi:DNA-binding transcriptional MerR regulator